MCYSTSFSVHQGIPHACQVFQRFWDYQCTDAAEKFLDNWVTWALQTDFEPIKRRIARMLRSHKLLILSLAKAGRRQRDRLCLSLDDRGTIARHHAAHRKTLPRRRTMAHATAERHGGRLQLARQRSSLPADLPELVQ